MDQKANIFAIQNSGNGLPGPGPPHAHALSSDLEDAQARDLASERNDSAPVQHRSVAKER